MAILLSTICKQIERYKLPCEAMKFKNPLLCTCLIYPSPTPTPLNMDTLFMVGKGPNGCLQYKRAQVRIQRADTKWNKIDNKKEGEVSHYILEKIINKGNIYYQVLFVSK